MLLYKTINTRGITESLLPPRASSGKFRLLTIIMKYVGLSSLSMEFERYSAVHDDIEHVSVVLDPPLWAKVFGRNFDIGPAYSFTAERSRWANRKAIGAWFRSAIPLERFDAVHCSAQYVATGVLDKRPRGTAVSVHMDASQMNIKETWGDYDAWGRSVIASEQWLYDHVDLIAANSEWCASSLTRHHAVPRSKIIIAPPSAEVIPRPDLVSGDFLKVDRKPRILFIGNDWNRKGGPDLLRWHQQHWLNTAELHVVGDRGPDAPGVTYYGRVPRQKLLTEIVPTCDVFCLPTHRDMSPWVVAESAASGLPAIATRMAGIPEMIDDGKTGYLIDHGDEAGFIRRISELLSDREHARQMGLAAQDFARRTLSREVVCGNVLTALRAAAAARQNTTSSPAPQANGAAPAFARGPRA